MTEIETLGEAKEASLAKWRDVRTRVYELFKLVDGRCGFCFYTVNTTGQIHSCASCRVREKCKEINRTFSHLETTLIDEVGKVINYIEGVSDDAS